jgi:hypothetical protein
MIERCTIKFAPAVSQKDLEKALHESGETPIQSLSARHKMKACIELIGDFDDVKKLSALLDGRTSLLSRRVRDSSASCPRSARPHFQTDHVSESVRNKIEIHYQ